MYATAHFVADISSPLVGKTQQHLHKVIVCNLFMERFEVKALDSYSHPPRFWGRYIDDGVAVIKTSIIESFTSHLNSQHKNIKWTSELESNCTVAMLDMLITRKTGSSLKFSVYRKPTHRPISTI